MPYPLHGGVQIRVFHLLRRIAQHHEVTLGCHSWEDEDEENARWLSAHAFPTITGRLTAANRHHALPALRAALKGHPPEIVQYQSPTLHALVRDRHFDILQVEETSLAPYADSLAPETRARSVITFHNIQFVQARRIGELEPSAWRRSWRRINASLMRRYEPAIARKFHRSVVVTEVDRLLLTGAAPDVTPDVIPNGVDTRELQLLPEDGRRTAIVFVGTLSYLPCADAVQWLVRELLPLLRRAVPDIEVWIVGKGAPPEVEALAGENIFVTGAVPDTADYYRRASVAVVPLRAGGGSRLKILEAMSLGRPVVSTTIGAEGLDVCDGEHALIADEPQAFVDAILRLLKDQALWRALVRNARRFVERRHDWDALAAKQMQVYDELAASR